MIFIQSATVHTGRGQVLENTDLLIEHGKIAAIGPALPVPEGAKLIPAAGLELFPGFVEPLTIMGCQDGRMYDNNECTCPMTPELDVRYAVEHQHLAVQRFYDMGITTVGIGPWNTNLLGGVMSVYKTFGDKAHEQIRSSNCIMKGSVTDLVKQTHTERKRPPMTKMGMFAMLEKTLREADAYQTPGPGGRPNPGLENVKKVISGEMPLIMSANRATEVIGLLEIFKAYPNVKLTIACAYEAWQYADELRSRNVSLILGDQIGHGAYNDDLPLDKFIEMHNSGIDISLSFSSDSRFAGKQMYLWSALNMYRAGLDAEEVIRMMTWNPAKILGVEDTLGSIEEGKIADLVLYDGHPIKTFRAKAVMTFMDGRVVSEGVEVC